MMQFLIRKERPALALTGGALVCLALAGLSGCREERVESYSVPKGSETIAETATEAPPPGPMEGQELPPGHPPIGGPSTVGDAELPEGHPPIDGSPMVGGPELPEGHPPIGDSPAVETAAPADKPWTVPDGWREMADTPPMRLATYLIDDPDGPVEVAITRFPGDVGGVPANVNRWRGQIGLPAMDEDAVEEIIERFEAPGYAGYEVHLEGPELHMLASGIHDLTADETWFVRVTAPAQPVERVREEVFAFARSFTGMEAGRDAGAPADSAY